MADTPFPPQQNQNPSAGQPIPPTPPTLFEEPVMPTPPAPPTIQPPAPPAQPESLTEQSMPFPPKPMDFDDMLAQVGASPQTTPTPPPPLPSDPMAPPMYPPASTPTPEPLTPSVGAPAPEIPIQPPVPVPQPQPMDPLPVQSGQPPTPPPPIPAMPLEQPQASGPGGIFDQPIGGSATPPPTPLQPQSPPPTLQQAMLTEDEQDQMFARERLSGLQKAIIIFIALVALCAVGGVGYWLYKETMTLTEEPPVIMDTDGDGLTDAREEELGTDKTKPDTDGDSFSDGEEVQNGYNPNGSGKLTNSAQ